MRTASSSWFLDRTATPRSTTCNESRDPLSRNWIARVDGLNVTTLYTYDAGGRVLTIQNLAPAGSTVNGLPTMTGSDGLVHPVYSAYSGLSYDENSNLLGYAYKFSYYTQIPQGGSQWTPMSGTVAYTFSNAEVLTSEIWSGSISKSYTYAQSAGNLSTLRSISFGTNTTLDQISSSGAIGVNTTSNTSETYANSLYDVEGNMTQFRGLTATYNPDGTMATTVIPGANDSHGNVIDLGGSTTWAYDAEGHLTTLDSVYDGDNLVAQEGVFYVWGPTGPVLAINYGQQIESLTYDPAGSLVHIVMPPSQTASYASTYVFDAYGLPIDYWPSLWTPSTYNNVTINSAIDDIAFLYKGQAGYDSVGGWQEYKASDGTLVCGEALINCWSRWYDPFSGRWITRDPAGLEGGENAYEFCDGNPLTIVDPSGLDGESLAERALKIKASFERGYNSFLGGVWSGVSFGHSDDLFNWADSHAKFLGLRSYTGGSLHETGSAAGQFGAMFIPVEDVLDGVRVFEWIKTAVSAEKFVDPRIIRFTQNSISAAFKDGRQLQETIDDLRSGALKMKDLPAIRVYLKDGVLWSLDNRRLAVAKYLGLPIKVVEATARDIAKSRFSTKNAGRIIGIRAGGWFQ